ncbi:exported hypothetical protein [Candidatus Sulfobium mesophilum]|uniref:Alkyl hydroperoxide reductase subunit C/ Thiol specific antioxidant domain-containing protein n=1 Tax=Candidatus Sulfobium mesophilum TaxID=2016548 RepID=A0A2U3QJL8_9BACT|nr:exported hypothetical protein [Candidatus Sulfobium mesophilum]
MSTGKKAIVVVFAVALNIILMVSCAVARRYGVYREKDGEAERALFVIDAEGVIRWTYVSPVGINPGADGILKALESIADGKKTG